MALKPLVPTVMLTAATVALFVRRAVAPDSHPLLASITMWLVVLAMLYLP